jgi:hypothetical protein
MAKYYVNNREQANGDHEVHREGCYYLPLIVSKTDLGEHYTCESAVRKAIEIFKQSNGCRTCSNDCHSS